MDSGPGCLHFLRHLDSFLQAARPGTWTPAGAGNHSISPPCMTESQAAFSVQHMGKLRCLLQAPKLPHASANYTLMTLNWLFDQLDGIKRQQVSGLT